VGRPNSGVRVGPEKKKWFSLFLKYVNSAISYKIHIKINKAVKIMKLFV
jgi:hypothetical protein